MMLVYICLPAIIWGLMQLKRPLLWLCIAIVISLAIRFVALAAQPDQAVVLFTHLLDRDGVLPLAEDLYFRPWFRLTPFILGITLAISTRNSSSKIDRMIASAPQRIPRDPWPLGNDFTQYHGHLLVSYAAYSRRRRHHISQHPTRCIGTRNRLARLGRLHRRNVAQLRPIGGPQPVY